MTYIFYDEWMECIVPTLTYSKDNNHENKNENGSESSSFGADFIFVFMIFIHVISKGWHFTFHPYNIEYIDFEYP